MSAPTVDQPPAQVVPPSRKLPLPLRALAALGHLLLRFRRSLRRLGSATRHALERIGRAPLIAGAVAALSVAVVGLAVIALPVAGAWWGGVEPPGPWQEAVAVAGSMWVMSYGVPLRLLGVDYTLIPWGLMIVPAFLGHQAGRWLVRVVRPRRWRTAIVAWLAATLIGTGFVAVVSVLADISTVQTSARRAVLAATVVGAVSIGSGMWRASDLIRSGFARLPMFVLVVARASAVAFAALVGFASIVLAIAVASSFGEIATLFTALAPTLSDAIVLSILSLAYLPVFIGWSLSYILGAGVTLGPDVLISPFVPAIPAVPLPAFPPLAALPEVAGPASWAFPVLVVISGGVCGLAISRFAAREQPLIRLSLAVAAAGLAALWVLALLQASSGSFGDGRLLNIGPDSGLGALLAGVGLLVGALPTSVLRARRKPRRLQAVTAGEGE